MTVYAQEKNYVYEKLDDIPENKEIFITISEGSISVIERNNEFYYVFKRNNNPDVLIKASAFQKPPQNKHLKYDNNYINGRLQDNSNHTYDRICYYTKFEKQEKYIKPSTDLEYMEALARTPSGQTIIPEITVEVRNTGNNNIYLSKYSFLGKGLTDDNDNDLTTILFSTLQLGADIATKEYVSTASNSIELFTDILDISASNLKKKSKDYYETKYIYLSKNDEYVYEVTYLSPIKLAQKEDHIEIRTKCNQSLDDATIGVSFNFK